VVGLLILGAVCGVGRADTLADLRRPSSTIPGCVNDWGPLGTGDGVATPTCEGKAARTAWQTHAAAINVARDTLVTASNLPAARTSPQTVVNALDAAAAAVDAMQRLDHPSTPSPRGFADVLAWMRPWFAQQHHPIPTTIGDGLRTLAEAVAKPDLLRADRTALYDQAAIFVTRVSELAAERGGAVQRQTDAAVRAAHRAALQAAQAIETGRAAPQADTAIATAAGPAHTPLAREQTRQLDQSLAAHPDQGGYRAQTARALGAIPGDLAGVVALTVLMLALGFRRLAVGQGAGQAVRSGLRLLICVPLAWLMLALLHAVTGFPAGWIGWPLWLVMVVILIAYGGKLVPGPLRRLGQALFTAPVRQTHGSAAFGSEHAATRHLAPAAPVDAFVLGTVLGAPRGVDPRFRQDGHILTCAPTGAGKGIGAVIPNLLDYPGSAFVLDLKGENYAVTARARRAMGRAVVLIDPFAITGTAGHALNWLDTLDPDDPDVVSRAAALADMLVVTGGTDSDAHWNDTARELLRGLLIHVAGLPAERRSMAELRRIVTASEDDWADTLAAMLADPERGQRIPARAAAAHLNRPERERGSVLSTVVRHTAWLDDPRLCAALARSDFSFADLKRKSMTVYLAIPPDRLRACLGFVRGFIGLALDGIIATPVRPPQRVAFFLDEFGQLGRMDRLADSVTLLRGYGAQLWLFVQDLSQLKAVYPRWQSFLANTTQQFFGTADYDTARYLSGALGQQTVRYETHGSSVSRGGFARPAHVGSSASEHVQGRALLTPDEIMRLGPTRPIVLLSGEPPYLLERLSYLTDPAYAGRFDPNPMHTVTDNL
jgi:type IV secretory pathway TraG/TraD family ATPase VirD4